MGSDDSTWSRGARLTRTGTTGSGIDEELQVKPNSISERRLWAATVYLAWYDVVSFFEKEYPTQDDLRLAKEARKWILQPLKSTDNPVVKSFSWACEVAVFPECPKFLIEKIKKQCSRELPFSLPPHPTSKYPRKRFIPSGFQRKRF